MWLLHAAHYRDRVHKRFLSKKRGSYYETTTLPEGITTWSTLHYDAQLLIWRWQRPKWICIELTAWSGRTQQQGIWHWLGTSRQQSKLLCLQQLPSHVTGLFNSGCCIHTHRKHWVGFLSLQGTVTHTGHTMARMGTIVSLLHKGGYRLVCWDSKANITSWHVPVNTTQLKLIHKNTN